MVSFWHRDPMMRTFLGNAHQDVRMENQKIRLHFEAQQAQCQEDYRQLMQQEDDYLHQRLALSKEGQ